MCCPDIDGDGDSDTCLVCLPLMCLIGYCCCKKCKDEDRGAGYAVPGGGGGYPMGPAQGGYMPPGGGYAPPPPPGSYGPPGGAYGYPGQPNYGPSPYGQPQVPQQPYQPYPQPGGGAYPPQQQQQFYYPQQQGPAPDYKPQAGSSIVNFVQ